MRLRLRNTGLSILFISTTMLFGFLINFFLDADLLPLYKTRFIFHPGSWFGEHLQKSHTKRNEACLIIGASTAREGFDEALLDKLVPGTHFYNAATTGGNISIYETQAKIIAHYGFHYRCIIVPVHSWLLFSSETAFPSLNATEYIAHLGFFDILGLTYNPLVSTEALEIVRTFIIPLQKHAPQLNRLVRSNLYRMHQKWFSKRLSLSRYELYDGELVSGSDKFYKDIPTPMKKVKENLQLLHFFDRTIYAQAETIKSWENTFKLLQTETEQIIVVRMPSRNIMNKPGQWAEPAFLDVINKYSKNTIYLDFRKGFTPQEFIDHTHLNSKGRQHLTRDFGEVLSMQALLSPPDNPLKKPNLG